MRILMVFSLVALIVLCSCIDITNIRQPKDVGAGQVFEVHLDCSYTISDDDGDISGVDYWGVLAIQIPDDWKVINTEYSGSNSGSFSETDKVTTVVELDYPAQAGYRWVGYRTYDAVQVDPQAKELRYDVKIKLQAGTSKGEFQPDYKLGISEEPEIKSTSITWGETTVEVPAITVK